MTARAIWWMRRDLRLSDNQALTSAATSGDEILPVFVLDPRLLGSSYAGQRRIDFLLAGLASLDTDLRKIGSYLIVRRGDPAVELKKLCQAYDVSAIYAEADISPYARQRDARLTAALDDVQVVLTDGVAIRPIGSVLKGDGSHYTVFTPYSRRWRAQATISDDLLLPPPAQISTPAGIESEPIPGNVPSISEQHALGQLRRFIQGKERPIDRYAQNRDRPDLDGTSMLSRFLRFGMISARTAAAAAYVATESASSETAQKGADTWLNELIWRDFYLNILSAFPHVRKRSFRLEYDRIHWQNDPDEFAAWKEGHTGYPFVDAAMRQLLRTGWMHNRARMVVASFLVKDLLIDWRWGERWFMLQLIDGDPAANNGGWQWSAGTGTDAAPYFRIFNPVAQGKKFDPDGIYVRTWVPELAQVPTKYIHEPWKLSVNDQENMGCRVGQIYPAPIVDHAWARERTLAAYKRARDG